MEELKEIEKNDSESPSESVISLTDNLNQIDNKKLHRKINYKMIEVSVSSLLVMVLIAFNQGQKLFLFDFKSISSAGDTIQSVISGRVFGFIVYGLLSFLLLFTIYLFVMVKKNKLKYSILKRHYDFYDLLGVVPVFLSIVVVINAFFFSPAVVHGPSMEPTFFENDAVIIYHLSHEFSKQDVIIYDRGDALLIKRLIGMPGDHLRVDHTGVYLNGINLMVEGYETEYHEYNDIIPNGFYFIMGDNDPESNDSRYFGLVKEQDILGKVIVRF